MFREILVTSIGMDKWSYRLITIVFMIISIQYIPSPRSSIFWFNGCAHYMIPFVMCQFLVYALLRFGRKFSYPWYVVICIFMALLGGANYQAALFALIAAFYVGVGTEDYLNKKNKKILWLLFPVILEIVGLVISMEAPGNKVRGGEEFGLSASKAASTIGLSFVGGIRDIGNYITNKPLIFVGLIFLFLIFLNIFQEEECRRIKHPILAVLALFCLYSAMQAPAIYAAVSVSGGVYNMNYQMFLLCASGTLLIISQYIAVKCHAFIARFQSRILVIGFVVCQVLLVIGRSNIKASTLWVSMEYITSGQAVDYKLQMDLQTELLTDENTADVVLPFINDVQGPLMHMPVTADPDAWTNTVTKRFYGKNSVVAMPRSEWEKLYLQ